MLNNLPKVTVRTLRALEKSHFFSPSSTWIPGKNNKDSESERVVTLRSACGLMSEREGREKATPGCCTLEEVGFAAEGGSYAYMFAYACFRSFSTS